MGTSSASPSSPVPRPCTTVDRPCTQAPGGLWDTPRLRRLGRGAALRTGSSSPMSLGRSGLPDGPDDRSSKPSATYKDAPAAHAVWEGRVIAGEARDVGKMRPGFRREDRS